jgi:endonuclease YncB( thermonuclease family)
VLAAPAGAAEYSGRVDRVVDGDTFWVCGAAACTKIRLCGIDAPEKGTPGAKEATAALAALVSGKSVRCVQVGGGTPCDGRSKPTSYDRIVAQCFAGGADVSAPLVEHGNACDWTGFSGGAYSNGYPERQCAACAPMTTRSSGSCATS